MSTLSPALRILDNPGHGGLGHVGLAAERGDLPMNSRLRCFCQLGDLAGDAGFLSATRQHIHQHPELSFQEADTAALVARHLDDWGWAVTRGVGGHGVVGTLRAGGSPRSVACAPTWTPCPSPKPPARPTPAATPA
jgi:hippurate hydrolase